MGRLLACPFCREMFSDGEASRCGTCDVALVPMDRLPPSMDAIAEEAERGQLVRPEDRRLPFAYLGRGRGALVLLSVIGLILFFSPWVTMSRPYELVFSGFELARGRAGWLWGGAIAWFILLPLVVSRRSIHEMRGVRIIVTMFASMTLIECIGLIVMPAQSNKVVSVAFDWSWAYYASALVSLLGIAFGVRFGGSVDDLPSVPWEDAAGNVRVDTSDGEVLH